MRTTTYGTLLAAILMLPCGATTANAAVIISTNASVLPGNSTGTIGPLGVTPAPNNANAGAANPNVIPYNIFFNSLGLLEVEFNVANSGATTEYRFTQAFINNSGQTWSSFAFELGFGTGASFVRSGSDSLDFDTPDLDPPPTASQFSTLEHHANLIRWSGGTVPSIGTVAFALAIDVPDNISGINPYGVNRFTLRQTPNASVPEPATLLLLGASLAGLGLRSRRRS